MWYEWWNRAFCKGDKLQDFGAYEYNARQSSVRWRFEEKGQKAKNTTQKLDWLDDKVRNV